jgi:hypothetical protein
MLLFLLADLSDYLQSHSCSGSIHGFLRPQQSAMVPPVVTRFRLRAPVSRENPRIPEFGRGFRGIRHGSLAGAIGSPSEVSSQLISHNELLGVGKRKG